MCGKRVSVILSIILVIILILPVVNLSANKPEQKPTPKMNPVNNEAFGFPPGWSDDIQLTFIPGLGSNVRASMITNRDVIHIVWENMTDGHIGYCRSEDAGRTWTEPRIITSGNVAGNPRIAINGSHIHVVYEKDTGFTSEIMYQNSTDNGETWSLPVMLSLNDGVWCAIPDIAVDGDNIHAVWEDEDASGPGSYEIIYRNSTDGGKTWNSQVQLTNYPGGSDASAKIAINESVVHVVWGRFVTATGSFETMYRRSLDGGSIWEAEMQITKPGSGHSYAPDLAVNGSNVYAIWMDSRDGSWETYINTSFDDGQTWNGEIRLTDVDGRNSFGAHVGVWNETVYVVWGDPRDDYPYPEAHEAYMNYSFDGGVTWQSSNERLQFALNNSGPNDIALTENYIHVVMKDNRTGKREIYYKRYPDFQTDTTAPSIVHTPIPNTPIGQLINITAKVSDNVALSEVWLNYTGINGTNYNVSMTGWDQKKVMVSGLGQTLYAQDGNYSFEIPAQNGVGVVSYYIWAEDVEGNFKNSPWGGSYFVQVTGPPSIEVTNPVGGEIWTGGSNHQIEFTASDSEDDPANLTVFLNYTSGAGGAIAILQGNQTPYSWTLPTINAIDVKVNATVVDRDGNKAYGDSEMFEIDTSLPEAVSTMPANGTTGVFIYQSVVIQFNEPMNTSTVTAAQTGGIDPGSWSWFWNVDKDTITGIHDAWSRGDIIEITVQPNYKDDSDQGNANSTSCVFSFTTETNPSPEIVHTNISSPQELGDEIRINATITDDSTVMNAVLWWQDIDGVWHENYMSKNGDDWEYWIPGQMAEGKISYQINATDDLQQKNTTIIYEFNVEDTTPPVIVHTPVESVLINESINITCQVSDLGGANASAVYLFYKCAGETDYTQVTMNPGFWYEIPAQSIPTTIEYYLLASDFYGNNASTSLYSFDVIDTSIPDTTPPVIAHTPVESAVIGESINISCQVIDLDGVDIVYLNYKNESDVNFIQVTMNPGYWFELPAHFLPTIIEYYIQAFDISGNEAATQTYSLEIIDPSVPDTMPPEVLLATPTGDNFPISTSISVVFSEYMNTTSVEGAISISLDISFSSSWANNQTLVLSFTGNLSYDTTYTVTIDSGAKDLAGNTLASDYSWQFTTLGEPEVVQPTASNDWGWIGIIIFLISFIALILIHGVYKEEL